MAHRLHRLHGFLKISAAKAAISLIGFAQPIAALAAEICVMAIAMRSKIPCNLCNLCEIEFHKLELGKLENLKIIKLK